MDGVNNAFCLSKEEYEIARLATKCAGLQLKIDDQAAEITSLQETLDVVTGVASDAENLVISQRDEIEKYKALCDQMGNALELMLKSATHYGEAWAKCYVDDYERVAIDSKEMHFKLLAICRDKLQDVPEALEAWKAIK